MKKLILLIFCVVGAVTFVFGQSKTADTTDNNNPLNHKGHPGGKIPADVYEKIRDVSTNPYNHKGGPGTRLPVILPGRRLDTVQLPFRDDFSYKHSYPDTILWFDNYAYINSTYPTNPISYGVATLSGLNQNGVAFAIADSALLGISYSGADSLTSMAINLAPFSSGNTGLYLSFSFEPEGLGDYPSLTGEEPGDSLILEFSENDTTWDEVWSHDGYANDISNPTFQDVYISVDSLPNAAAYYRGNFQFRFRNYADILGNNNHWHIDYVYMNSGRKDFGTYTDTYKAVGGCDSVRVLYLGTANVIYDTVNTTICQGASYSGHDSSGTYTDTFAASGGCDSIRTVNLTVASSIATTINQTICFGSSYAGYTSSGTYLDTYTGVGGCDSNRTLNLTVLGDGGSMADTVSATICGGGSYAGHTASGTYKNDLTLLQSPGYFLRNYTAMPWTHFYNYQQQEIGDSLHFCVTNHFNTALSPTIHLDLTEIRSNTPIPIPAFSGGFTVNSEESFCFTHSLLDSLVFVPADTDSVVMRVRTYVDHTPNDDYPDNDTTYTDVDFYNYFAYDDGSAEKAFGLEGEETSFLQFAYEFHLNHPDTLRAIQIHFTSIDYNTDLDQFTVMVWKKLNVANNPNLQDSILYFESYRMPLFVDSINAFATFTIKPGSVDTNVIKFDSAMHLVDTPIIVSDTFYIGWQQTSGSNIEVGYDRNDDARQHMFYSADNVWGASILDSTLLPGAPMMRPVVGKNDHLIDTYVKNVVQPETSLRVYPNPVSTSLYATYQVDKEGTYAEVYDLLGRLVSRQAYYNNPIDVSNLQPGLYLLRFSSSSGSVSQVARFVKM